MFLFILVYVFTFVNARVCQLSCSERHSAESKILPNYRISKFLQFLAKTVALLRRMSQQLAAFTAYRIQLDDKDRSEQKDHTITYI